MSIKKILKKITLSWVPVNSTGKIFDSWIKNLGSIPLTPKTDWYFNPIIKIYHDEWLHETLSLKKNYSFPKKKKRKKRGEGQKKKKE